MGIFNTRSLRSIILLACAFIIATGCGKHTTNDASAHTIHVVRNVGGRAGFQQHAQAWQAAFEKSNPGWKMEVIDLGNSDAAEFYKSRIATDDLPEVVQTWGLTNFLADSGHLQPLPDSFYAKFGIPLPTAYKGKCYTSQGGLQIQGIAINKRMWNDAGITTPPQTWDEFVADLAKLKAKGYRPLVYGGHDWSAAIPLSYALQVALYRTVDPDKPSWTKLRDEGKVRFATDPTAKYVLTKMIALADAFIDKGAAGDGYNEEQRDFYGGKAATWIMGCWLAGDIESNKVAFDVEYWPIPALQLPSNQGVFGNVTFRPAFIGVGKQQTGWAVTTNATGEKRDKAVAVLEALYEPNSYQLYLNGEAMLKTASKVPVSGPKSQWPSAQKLFDNMAANLKKYGAIDGELRALDDQWPPSFDMALARVMQEILSGNHDVNALLKMLDDEWDNARKGQG